MAKIAFVHNFASHYTARTFELLARSFDVRFYFFSGGEDWYWLKEHGVKIGDFAYEYLRGFQLGRTRVTPTLPLKLMRADFDVCIKCINGRFALPITYLVARIKRRPFILWTGIWARLETPFHRLFFPLTRYFYRHADAVVVYGAHVKRYLISEGVRAERVFVAPHAVDNDIYASFVSDEGKAALRRQLAIDPGTKIVLYLGRLTPVKGLPHLARAFASLARKDVVLVLAGEGEERQRVEALARECGISDRVRFPGYVAQQETIRYYAASWVYVLPSITTARFKEPWGLVVNEAFNQGLPVIATDAVGAGAGGLVENDVNGFIVPEGNTQALAAALQRILDEPGLRERMSRNARERIATWTQEGMVEAFGQAIDYVTRNRDR